MAKLKERKIEGLVPDASGAATINFGNEKGYLLPKKHRWIMPEGMKGWIALIPAFFFLIIFMIYPIINALLMSFINNFYWVGGSNSSFAIINYFAALDNARGGIEVSWGVLNYIKCFQDQLFWTALKNTGLIVVVSVPLTIIIALLIAVCINAIKPLKGFYQTVFFLPYVTNSIALGMVFNVMFSSGSAGLFNSIISLFGADPQNWLGDMASRGNMFVVIVVYSIWNGLAFKILVFMSGLATIDRQYYDAARIDGASKTRIFGKITVPLLSPQILYITITSFIGATKSYTQIISLFGGGQTDFGGTDGTRWITIVGYIYKYMLSTNESALARAAAGSIILLVIVLIITGIQFLVSNKRVYY